MSISLSTVTGTAQTGLTSPTYTVTEDSRPENHAKQWMVTALGGTQTGVTTHAISSPFTIAFWKPKVYKTINWVNGLVGGTLRSAPRNVNKIIVRKGVTPAADQAAQTMLVTITVEVPAGAETYDSANVRACLSAAFGAASQQSSNFGDLVVVGSL